MIEPFHYQFTANRRDYQGQLFSVTGRYAGGLVRTEQVDSETREKETINVRKPDGKVITIELDHIIDPPEYSTITLLYYKTKKGYILFQLYVHETTDFHGITDGITKDCVRHMAGIGGARQLWSIIIAKIYFLLGIGVSFIALVAAKAFTGSDMLPFIAMLTVFAVSALLRRPLISLLGNSEARESAVRRELKAVCDSLINALPLHKTETETGFQALL